MIGRTPSSEDLTLHPDSEGGSPTLSGSSLLSLAMPGHAPLLTFTAVDAGGSPWIPKRSMLTVDDDQKACALTPEVRLMEAEQGVSAWWRDHWYTGHAKVILLLLGVRVESILLVLEDPESTNIS